MNKSVKNLCLALVLTGGCLTAQAQVKFKVSRSDTDTYIVSMVPEQTLTERQAITGTMQVSLKVKSSEGFELGTVKSLQPGVDWDRGTLIKSPDGARDYDYLSIALRSMATRLLAYEAGHEVPLFSFQNVGNSISDIQLLDNANDPLINAKGNVFNVPNHISVLGLGRKNAYSGNLADDSPVSKKIGLQRLFPNPANSQVTVVWTNFLNGYEGEVALAITESGTGRVLSREKAIMRSGTNSTVLNIGQLIEGLYIILLEKEGAKVGEGLKLIIAR